MRKYKVKQYIALFSLYTAGLTVTVLVPSLTIIERAKTDDYVKFNDLDIFMSVMATNTNYLSNLVIISLYILSFILGLNIIFFKTSPCLIARLKSRNEYIKKNIIYAVTFAFIFSFILEAVNIIYSFFVFGSELTLRNNLVYYSAIDFISEFLYYMRIGIALLLIEVILSKKSAPFVTFGIYALEFFGDMFILKSDGLWLPYKDAVIVTRLLTGEAGPIDIIPVIIRGVILNSLLITAAYCLFNKKDIIENEKK